MLTKEDLIEALQSKVVEALRVKKFHAKGGPTIHKKARNAGEIAKLTGKSKTDRRKQGIKLKRTLKTKGDGAKRRAAFKSKIAKKKRG